MASDEAGHLEKRLLDRQLFFTDAVFAIVLTILVLELKPPIGLPPDQEAEGLRHMLSHLGSFAFSFAVISVFWFAHMSTTSVQRRFDWWAALANLAFLFPICLIPFVSAWLGGGLGDLYTWRIYCWTLVATSVANVVLVLVASRGGGRLIGGVTRRQRVHRALRAASPGIAFSGGLILLSFDQLLLSQYIWLSIPVILFLERRVYPAEPSVDPADLPDAPKPRRAPRKAA